MLEQLINIIIFFIIIGYVLSNLSKLIRNRPEVEEGETEEKVYEADEEEIRRFLEKIGLSKKKPDESTTTPCRIKTLEPSVREEKRKSVSQPAQAIKVEPLFPPRPPEKKGMLPSVDTPFKPSIEQQALVKDMSKQQLRQAIVYSIILGPPRVQQPYQPPYQF